MKLTVVGCSGSFPGPNGPCSCYLVEADGFRALFDFGTGSLGALQRLGLLYEIDAIVLSHLHPDHFFDACSYVVSRRYNPAGAMAKIPLHAPTGGAARLAAAYGDGGLDDVYEFHTLRPGQFEIGPLSVTTDRMNHPVETYGFRIEHGGRTLTYSADTAGTPALVDLARGADLFLCEASYLDQPGNPPGVHLNGREAAEHAAAAGVGHLLLTHLVTAWGDEARTLDEATRVFTGPIGLARSGGVYLVGGELSVGSSI